MPRLSPAPFLRGRSWWARIPRLAASAVQRPLGVSGKENRDVAVDVCRFLAWCKGRRESFLLDAIATGKTSAGAAYTAYVGNRLDAFQRELRDGITDVDIEPFVARWQKELARRSKPNAHTRAKYLRQVRTLIVEGVPFRQSRFTKQAIRAWLADLDVGQPNRYRAALSSFAEYLVFEDVIPSNPVRLVPMASERAPRTLHLSPDDALRLLAALPQPYQALHALMVSTGMELGAALALRSGDVDLANREAFARGTKRIHRQRRVVVYAPWVTHWAHFADWFKARRLVGDVAVFAGVTPWGAYRALKAALAVKELDGDYRVHDHRHTWAVQAVRDGIALHSIAHQLGHRDATMVLKVYGRYVPTAADFNRNATASATPTANTASAT